jgi:6-phosphofructokinase 1
METRVTVLGHVQRGAAPNASDRLLASAFGVKAVDLIAEGKFDRMVAWRHGKVVDIPILEAISQYQTVDVNGPIVETARGLGICFGDRS